MSIGVRVAGGAVLLALCLTAGPARTETVPADAFEVPAMTSPADQQAARLARAGEGAELRSYAETWLRANRNSANAWFYHGLGAELAAKPGWAENDYRQALSLDPGNGAAAFGLGRVLFGMGKNAAAIAPLRQAVAAYPRNNRAWADLGLALGNVGQPQEAAAMLERSVALNPGNGYHAGELGDAYAALGQYAKAIPLYEQASRKSPRDEANVIWLQNLGEVYELTGNYQRSVLVMQQVLRATPNDPDVWSCLWVDYLRLGDEPHAAQARAMLARFTAQAARPTGSGSSFARVVAGVARQQNEAYLHNTGRLGLNEHLP